MNRPRPRALWRAYPTTITWLTVCMSIVVLCALIPTK